MGIGRDLGSDYIDYIFDTKSSDSCNPEVWDQKFAAYTWYYEIFGGENRFTGLYARQYINPDDPNTYLTGELINQNYFLVIPTNKIDVLDNYWSGTLTRTEGKNIWNFEYSSGDFEMRFLLEYGDDGVFFPISKLTCNIDSNLSYSI